MIEFLQAPLPWYVAGILLGITVPVLLLLGNKAFGVSGSLSNICQAGIASFRSQDKSLWEQVKGGSWNIAFVVGIILGGFIAGQYLTQDNIPGISTSTKSALNDLGLEKPEAYILSDVQNWSNLSNISGILFVVLGGLMVGFGSRYARGCTSGHAILGISNLQLPSIIATVFFFIGGLIATYFIIPQVLNL